MIWLALLSAPAVASAAYWLLVIVTAVRWVITPVHDSGGSEHVPVSILKPVCGRDPHFYEAIRSHAVQDYPEYEILFGTSDPQDPAVADIERLIAEFPDRKIRLITTSTALPNRKAGVLADLAAEARHPLLLINDSDISVQPDYLREVTAALAQPETGLVTCLYRAQSDAWPGRWEALGVATEFIPSVVVAHSLGLAEFALGSTMLLRARDLRSIGGFASIGEYLADDYRLGIEMTRLGLRVAFANPVVRTHLSGESWAAVWRHQLRWSRGIRVSRPGGYYGYILTQATFWSMMAFMAGSAPVAVLTLSLRLMAGLVVGCGILGDLSAALYFYLIPLRDLWGFAIWCCGLFGSKVEWRGQHLRIASDGKIIKDL